MEEPENKLIIYKSDDGNTSVSLLAKDGTVWMNQLQLAELFATSKQNIILHIINILKENELNVDSVVKEYLTTAEDGKKYKVTFYSLEMILAIGFRVRSIRGTQFKQWANRNKLVLQFMKNLKAEGKHLKPGLRMKKKWKN